MLHVRRAIASDADAASDILCASIRALCGADHGDAPAVIDRWTANKTSAHVARWILDPGQVVFVAERHGIGVGIGAATKAGEILLNYVAPAFRGIGVSSALLSELEDALVALGHGEATLTSTTTAHDFYRHHGWLDVGDPVQTFSVVGWPMRKSLGNTS